MTDLLDLHDVIRLPRLVEELDVSSVKADDRHKVSTFNRLDPVSISYALRFCWSKMEIDRAVLIFGNTLVETVF